MNSYSSLDIAISICRYIPIYQLYNYKNQCDKIEKEIEKVLKPSRQKVLRGYYLMNTLNNIIDKKSDIMIDEVSNNSNITELIQDLQNNISATVNELKDYIESVYRTSININEDTDAQILSRFNNESKASDLIYIRNVSSQARDSMLVPINLTQNNMYEIGYNNKRIDSNLSSLKGSAEKLASTLSLTKKYNFIKEVIYKAINIHLKFQEEGLDDYIKTHTNSEVKEWLYGRIS